MSEAQRQIVLDTETTGMSAAQGHRVIEIGCIELVDRMPTGNHFHYYLQPDRDIDWGAQQVHGITAKFLQDKPRFHDVVDEFLNYIKGSELVIHNATFDVGFLDHELKWLESDVGEIADYASVLDTLTMARKKHPGQRNSLDALCKRYFVDNANRTLHGALLDAELLADVYLAMTSGQNALGLEAKRKQQAAEPALQIDTTELPVLKADAKECAAHEANLAGLDKTCSDGAVWRRLET